MVRWFIITPMPGRVQGWVGAARTASRGRDDMSLALIQKSSASPWGRNGVVSSQPCTHGRLNQTDWAVDLPVGEAIA